MREAGREILSRKEALRAIREILLNFFTISFTGLILILLLILYF